MPKIYDKKFKAQAKNLYVFKNMSFEDIAKTLKVHVNTLRKWSQEDNWDSMIDLKNANSMQIEVHAIEQIAMILMRVNEEARILTPGEVDTIAKLRKLIETTNAEAAFASNAIEATSLFMDFLREKAPHLLSEVSEFAVEFASSIASRHMKG